MPGLKVTRELHAEVRESLKTMGIMKVAEKHHLSPQTVSRIRRGKSYLGYKRELTADHSPSFMVRDDEPDFIDMPMTKPSAAKRGIFHRLRRMRG